MKKYSPRKLPIWVVSLGIYLVLVWGFAIIRSNYLWITGDDPNLLIQAELTSRGGQPNLDFTSGYPGLSQHVQALLIDAFGFNIFSQHLYSAILASITGVLVYLNFKKIKPWLLSTALVLIYCQQHLVNPTPNPGHLFEVIILTSYTILRESKSSTNKKIVSASIFLGVAFLAKQYAIFLIIGFVLSEIAKLDWKKFKTAKTLFILILGLTSSLGYFVFLIPNTNSKYFALTNLFILVTPFIYWTWMVRSRKLGSIEFESPLKGIIGSSIIFVSTVSIGLCLMYRTTHILEISRKILIEAPRSINSNVVLIEHNARSIISIVAFIGFVFLIYLMNKIDTRKTFNNIASLLATIFLSVCTVAAFSKIGNLSSNLFLALYPIFIMYLYLRKNIYLKPQVFSFFFVLSAYMFVLIPYPNVNFHIVILVFGTLIVLQENFPEFSQPSKKVSLLFPILLTASLLVHEQISIKNMQTYQFANIIFKSSSNSWGASVLHAREAEMNFQSCPDMGCKLLILMAEDKLSSNYHNLK